MRKVEQFTYVNDMPVVYWNVNNTCACINAPTGIICPQKFLAVKSMLIVMYGIMQNFHRIKWVYDGSKPGNY